MNEYFLVYNYERTIFFITCNGQLAYEVRKGEDSNCYSEQGDLKEEAIRYCKHVSWEEQCYMTNFKTTKVIDERVYDIYDEDESMIEFINIILAEVKDDVG